MEHRSGPVTYDDLVTDRIAECSTWNNACFPVNQTKVAAACNASAVARAYEAGKALKNRPPKRAISTFGGFDS